jgi:pyruvate ferredoxin oxidoreductase beta subunit
MNTGIQASSSTPLMAATTTTPAGKPVNRKNLMQIVGAHGIPYAATASVGYVDDLRKKVAKAKDVDGPAFLHIHAPCPTGWGYAPAKTIALAKLAVTTRCWNLYELLNGRDVIITKKIKKLDPVKDYLTAQKRFNKVSDGDLADIQAGIDADYAHLEKLASLSAPAKP